MASDIRVIAFGNTCFLMNSTGTPTVGGSPSVQNQTPFSVLKDNWAMASAVPNTAYQGGPPFDLGSTLAYQAYGNTEQVIPITVQGSNYNNSVLDLQFLHQLLNNSENGLPALLYYQPNTSTNPLYFQIQSGWIQERPIPLNPGAGFAYIEADLHLVMKPLGCLISAGETVINTVTATVGGGTGVTPTNTMALTGSPSGDFLYEGQPMNYKIVPTTAGSNIGEVWLANVYDAGANLVNVNLAAYPTVTSTQNINAPSTILHNSTKVRIIARVNNATGGAVSKYRLGIRGNLGGSAYFFLTPPQGVSPTAESFGLVDFGPVSVDLFRSVSPLSSSVGMAIEIFATTSAGTCSLVNVELLTYIDFCKVKSVNVTQAGGQYLYLNSFIEKSNQACLPSTQSANNLTSTDSLYTPAILTGSIPRAIAGAAIWIQWLDSTGANPSTTRQATVKGTQAPLWFTMRGAD